MPINEFERRRAEKTLRDYCARRTKSAVRHQLDIVYRLARNDAYIAERRPDWLDAAIRGATTHLLIQHPGGLK